MKSILVNRVEANEALSRGIMPHTYLKRRFQEEHGLEFSCQDLADSTLFDWEAVGAESYQITYLKPMSNPKPVSLPNMPPPPELTLTIKAKREGMDFYVELSKIEKALVEFYLAQAHGNCNVAAKLMGLSRTALVEKRRRFGLPIRSVAPRPKEKAPCPSQ